MGALGRGYRCDGARGREGGINPKGKRVGGGLISEEIFAHKKSVHNKQKAGLCTAKFVWHKMAKGGRRPRGVTHLRKGDTPVAPQKR